MADARLVATNPADSSLVPVACTPEGLLKTEGGSEGPPGPKGDPGPEGPPGPKGDPATNGLPDYSEANDGQILAIRDGVPVWDAQAGWVGVWSDQLTCPSSAFSTTYVKTNAFDGDFNTYTETITANPICRLRIPFATTILMFRFWIGKGAAFWNNTEWTVTLGDLTRSYTVYDFTQAIDVTHLVGTQVQAGDQIDINCTSAGKWTSFCQFELNGQELRDPELLVKFNKHIAQLEHTLSELTHK